MTILTPGNKGNEKNGEFRGDGWKEEEYHDAAYTTKHTKHVDALVVNIQKEITKPEMASSKRCVFSVQKGSWKGNGMSTRTSCPVEKEQVLPNTFIGGSPFGGCPLKQAYFHSLKTHFAWQSSGR